MGHRLTKIYTRTGDQGSTLIAKQQRVPKTHIAVVVLGDLDELNSVLGMVIAQAGISQQIIDCVLQIQQNLFDMGAELYLPESNRIKPQHIEALEKQIDELNAHLPYLKEFILPGGHPAAATCHFARSVCRRAERHLVALMTEKKMSADLPKYLNRLSDLLFVLARTINKDNIVPEIFWENVRD